MLKAAAGELAPGECDGEVSEDGEDGEAWPGHDPAFVMR